MKQFIKLTIILIGVIVCNEKGHSQDVQTYYYDMNYKRVANEQFADYIAYVSYATDSIPQNRFRILYKSGETFADGEFKKFDISDFSKTEFGDWSMFQKNGLRLSQQVTENGITKSYSWYDNGEKKQYIEFVNGIPHGEYAEWLENGHIKKYCTFKNGKVDGIQYDFDDEKQFCIQVEHKDGSPCKPYLTYVSKDGYVSKYKLSDYTPYLEIPALSELQHIQDTQGNRWDYYVKNGLALSVNANIKKDYGKYYSLDIVLTNNSGTPIQIDPTTITAYASKNGKMENLRVLTAQEYIDRVNRTHVWESGLNALAENYRANQAAYSASHSHTSTNYAGGSVSAAVGGVVGTHGAAIGGSVGATAYAGNVSTSNTTVSYDGYAAYQASLIAEQRISDYNNKLVNEQNLKRQEYLKPTVLQPGESVIGNININFKKADEVTVNVPIGSVIYPFKWKTN